MKLADKYREHCFETSQILTNTIRCPRCAETIQSEAKICRFCGHDITQSTAATFMQHNSNLIRLLVLAVLVILVGRCFDTSSQPPTETANLILQTERARLEQQGAQPVDHSAFAQPAPVGLPKVVAAKAIQHAGHSCKSVASAYRRPEDGSIIADCTSGERYRIFVMRGTGTVAMSCAAASRIGVADAC